MGRNTTQLLLTKGDNNDDNDVMLYKGRKWIEREHIIGKVKGYVEQSSSTRHLDEWISDNRFLPYVGYVTIAMVGHICHSADQSACADDRTISLS